MVLKIGDEQDLYGPPAAGPLSQIHESVPALAGHFADHFYDALASAAETADILKRLTPAEFATLQARQAEHLRALLAADLTLPSHMAVAERTGRVHALVGVDILWLIEAYSFYQYDLQRLLRPLVADAERRELVLRIVARRVLLDLQGQVASYRRIEQETAQAVTQIDLLVHSSNNFSDLVRGAMAIIGGLDGDIAAFLARADTAGELQVEASQGEAGQRYHQAMMDGRVPRISTDPDIPAGQGPGGRAWRSGEIVVADAWAIESATRLWQAVGTDLGFRSSAAVPLLDASGNSIALLSLYSAWPGCFSTLRMRNFLNHLQKSLSHALQHHNDAPVLPLAERQTYRRLLAERRVVMLYQPIIDLRNGRLSKVEALARLIGDDGALVPPGRFLAAFGADEFIALLRFGLEQAGTDCERLARAGLRPDVAINFPAEGLGDPRFENVVFDVLERGVVDPQRLHLEILESRAGEVNDETRVAFLQRIRAAGVRFSEDDLGSCHSSLLRMDQYSFDEVKIDQGLVRGALHRPQRALEFMLYLTRLSHAFATPLTVEGLENFGMIEAAAILGADFGQGYGIARPMPADALPAWREHFVFDIDPRRPRTAIGALAAYLLWDMQRGGSRDGGAMADRLSARDSVSHFIALHGLQGTELARLVEAQFSGVGPAQHQQRAQLIEQLTSYWIGEVAEQTAATVRTD